MSYIDDIVNKKNVERKRDYIFTIVHIVLFVVACFAGNSGGAGGFLAVYAAFILFAIGHDIGASKP